MDLWCRSPISLNLLAALEICMLQCNHHLINLQDCLLKKEPSLTFDSDRILKTKTTFSNVLTNCFIFPSTAVGQAVACAPVTQRARVRFPVGTGFLGEVFSGFSSPVRQISGSFRPPRSPNIIWPSLPSSVIIHYGRQWPEMLTRPKPSNIHKFIFPNGLCKRSSKTFCE